MGSDSGTTSNTVEGAVGGPVVQARSIGSVHIHGANGPAVPFQVPPGPARFVGREAALAELTRLRSHGPVVVSGMAGVGKTSVVLHWARQAEADYPDGQLYAHLGGAEPVSPASALEWFLLSLGAAPESVPVGADRRAALFRSLTARRRVLVVLDDAVSAAQVRPLLPAGPACAAVVTSRSRLSGLGMDGARWVDLQPLSQPDAVRLLRSVIGNDRVGAEAEAADEVAALCGGLPLALSVVAARLASRMRRTLARELADLAGERTRLAELALGREVSVEAVLDVARAGLDDDARAAYGCAGWHPGREFGAEAIAAGLGFAVRRAEDALLALADSGLASESDADRYSLHDLVRLHARQSRPPACERAIVEWYLDTAVAADRVVHPLRPRLGPRYATARTDRFPDNAAAIGWLERERANLVAALTAAASRNWDEVVWQFCEALWGLFLHNRHYGEFLDLQELGIAAAGRVGDARAEARVRLQAGYVHGKLGSRAEHRAEVAAARELARLSGDALTEASALEQLGLVVAHEDPDGAIAYFAQSRDAHERLGLPAGVALCRRRIGEVLTTLGRLDEAAAELSAAASTAAELGDPAQHTRAVTMLAEVHRRAGRADRALEALTGALRTMRDFGSRYYQAEILAAMADVDPSHADELRTRAAELYEQVGDPKAELVRAALAAARDST